VQVSGYRTELVRALDNLLTNASRYGRDDAGRLTLDVSLAATPRDVVLAVTDHGTGISPDQVDRLLRPFERGDSARSGSTGAGLGLAIVDRIARLHRCGSCSGPSSSVPRRIAFHQGPGGCGRCSWPVWRSGRRLLPWPALKTQSNQGHPHGDTRSAARSGQ